MNISLIDERSEIIPIQTTSPTKKTLDTYREYSLNESCFDPSKSSPPNNFMQKLQARLRLYENNARILINE